MEDAPAPERYLQIGEAADRAQLTQRTLRYYEEKGLLKTPTRMDGGFRLYSAEDMERSAANALLKLLEEPPPRALFLIVAHAPGRMLPTIPPGVARSPSSSVTRTSWPMSRTALRNSSIRSRLSAVPDGPLRVSATRNASMPSERGREAGT